MNEEQTRGKKENVSLPQVSARKAQEMILEEYSRAIAKSPPFHSAREGYGVIKEEFDELWEEIRKKDAVRSKAAMAEEAIQTSAMLLRFLIEICGGVEIGQKSNHSANPGSGKKSPETNSIRGNSYQGA